MLLEANPALLVPTALPNEPSVARVTEPAPDRLRLGMPHLSAHGLCENWLLRACAHRHWHMIAGPRAGLPTLLRDRHEARVFASFVSVVVDGNLAAFGEDDVVEFRTPLEPTARSGWRSVHEIARERPNGPTCRLRVELVSVFAKRGGPKNIELIAADMAPDFEPDLQPVRRARHDRSATLKRRSRTLRRAARRLAEGVPRASAPIVEASDFNGVGLLYFANYLRFVSLVERTRLDGPWTLPTVCRRELHYYGNADDGDTLDLHCDAHVVSVDPNPCVETFSAIARRSDGAVIAACETRRA